MKNRTKNRRFYKRYMLVWSCFYEFIELILITLNYSWTSCSGPGRRRRQRALCAHAISARAHVGESTLELLQFSIFSWSKETNKGQREKQCVVVLLLWLWTCLRLVSGHPQSSTCLGSHNAQLLIKAHSYLLLTTWYWDCHSFCQNVKMPRVPFLSTFILESTNMPGLGKTCHF